MNKFRELAKATNFNHYMGQHRDSENKNTIHDKIVSLRDAILQYNDAFIIRYKFNVLGGIATCNENNENFILIVEFILAYQKSQLFLLYGQILNIY